MASIDFINECKNPTYENRYGRIKIGEPAELTGDTISITDGQPHKVKDFKLSKLSTQYTTTGKSLLNPSRIEQATSHGGITCTYDADTQTITFNGTCNTDNTTFYFTNSGDDISDVTANLTTMTAYYVSGSIANYLMWRINSNNWTTSKGQDLVNIATEKVISFTSTTSFQLAQSSFSFRFNNGSVANNLKIKIMVANSTDTTYELFTNKIPAPNPDYPQKINVVEGYRNLFDASIIDYSSSNIVSKGDINGNITCSGTLSGTAFNITDNNTVDFPAGKYAISIQEPLPYILKFRLEGTSVNYVSMSAGSKNLVINLSENKTKMRIYMDGLTNNTNINFTFKLMIVKSEQDLSYVPYGTNYISNIIKAKNIFDYKTTTFSDINRVNIVAENDTLTITTTVATTGNNLFYWTRIPDYLLENGATYRISSENVSGVVQSLKLQLRNKDGSNANKPQDFTIVYDDNYALYITSNIFGGGSTSVPLGSVAIIKNIQVEKSSSSSTYEQYQCKTIPIPLNNNFICGIGNYKDQLIVDKDGHCYLNKKIGKYVYTGNESERWTFINSKNNNYLFQSLGVNIQIEDYSTTYLCSHALPNSASSGSGNVGSYVYGNKFRMRVPNTIATTGTDFSTWLVSNNVELYYPLATPQLIDLNYTADIELYEGINTITNSEDADMDIIYYKTVELNQSNKIQEFSIDDGCYIDGNIVGSVYVKKLNTQLIDALDNDIEDAECKVEVGLTYEDNNNNVTEYINLGKYIVDKPTDEQTANYTSFVAYDLLLQHLEEPYVTELDFENNTITIADVYIELCLRLGLIPVTTTFTNSTITVENNPFVNGEANRVVLNAIAKVACAFVDIDYDNNKIDLKWLSNTLNYTFNTGDYSTLECGKTIYGPINSLVIKSSFSDSENVSISDAQSIAENGEHQLVIIGDYFLYDATKRQTAVTEIWAKVNGLTYTECDLTTYTGKPFLKVGDKIRIYTDENTYIDSYVLQHTFTYDGSFKSVIKCPVLTEQQVQTKQDISLAEKLSNTEIIVNKQNATITSIASRTQTLENDNTTIKNKFNDYTPLSKTVDLETSVSEIQTDTYKKTEVKQILKGQFYDENNNQIVTEIVKTVSGTFDENGMTYEKTNANTKSTINEVGVGVRKTDGTNDYILFAGYVDENNTQYSDYKGQTLVATENIMVKKYLVEGTHSRIEDYEDGTGVFYIG